MSVASSTSSSGSCPKNAPLTARRRDQINDIGDSVLHANIEQHLKWTFMQTVHVLTAACKARSAADDKHAVKDPEEEAEEERNRERSLTKLEALTSAEYATTDGREELIAKRFAATQQSR